jgi:hypothetical protein
MAGYIRYCPPQATSYWSRNPMHLGTMNQCLICRRHESSVQNMIDFDKLAELGVETQFEGVFCCPRSVFVQLLDLSPERSVTPSPPSIRTYLTPLVWTSNGFRYGSQPTAPMHSKSTDLVQSYTCPECRTILLVHFTDARLIASAKF